MNQPIGTPTSTDNGNGMDGSSRAQSGSSSRFGTGLMRAKRDPETMRSELSSLKAELDTLVSKAASMGEQELAEAHDQIMSQFSSMRHAARGMAAQATRQLKGGVDVTSDYVKEKPMQSVGMAAGIGLLLGMLLARG